MRSVEEVRGKRSGCSAQPWSPIRPGRKASGSTASISRRARRSTASSISPRWSTAPRRLRGLDRRRHGHRAGRARDARKIMTFSVDPATGAMPHHGRRVASLPAACQAGRQAGGETLPGLRRQGHGPVESIRWWSPSGELVCLDAKSASMTTRSTAIPTSWRCAISPRRTRRRSRPPYDLAWHRQDHWLHGQRRGANDGDHGHHQLYGESPEFSMAAPAREGHRRLHDHHRRSR